MDNSKQYILNKFAGATVNKVGGIFHVQGIPFLNATGVSEALAWDAAAGALQDPIRQNAREKVAFANAFETGHPGSIELVDQGNVLAFIEKLEQSNLSGKPFMLSPALRNSTKSEHPCHTFAIASGFSSWEDVVAAIKAGQIVSGPTPRTGDKTIVGINMFMAEVHKIENVFPFYSEIGRVSLGLRDSFPAATVARVEAEAEAAAIFPQA